MSELSIQASYKDVRQINNWLIEVCDKFSCKDMQPKIELALVELCNNIVKHQTPQDEIKLSASLTGSTLSFYIVDQGKEFELPKDKDVPDSPQVHGYGLSIIESLTERFTLERNGERNIWHLDFSLQQ